MQYAKDISMKIQPLLLSALISTIIGGFCGLAIARIAHYDTSQLVYEQQLYNKIQKKYIILGSILGVALGTGVTLIKENAASNQSNLDNQD